MVLLGVVILFLRRVCRCLLISEGGSMVIEGVVIFPFFLLLVFCFGSFMSYFCVSSFVRQRVDGYGAYVCSVGGVVDGNVANMVSRSYLKSYLLRGGFLDEDRLVVGSDFDGGYLTVRVEYGLDVVLFGRVVVVDFYERRLW